MSLDWDITKCKDAALIKSEEHWDTTVAIIFETMAVGINQITQDTVKEFKLRSDFWHHLKYDPPLLSTDDIKLRIGLRTNVSTETRNKFIKRHTDAWFRDHSRYFDNIESAVAASGTCDPDCDHEPRDTREEDERDAFNERLDNHLNER